MSWSVPATRLSDQKGKARDTSTTTSARPMARREGPSASTRGIHVRHGDPGGIEFPQGKRWINNVRCGIGSAIEDVLFPAAPVDAFLELLVEFLVEFDRVRVDARTHDLHGLLEMRRRDLLRVLRLAQGDHRGLAAQTLDVRAGVAVQVDGEFFQVHALERHRASVDLEDREARILVRCRDQENPIESARAEHRRIEAVRAIRRADDADAFEGLEAVHRGQELIHHTFAHAAVRVEAADVGDRVELVEEDDARGDLLRLLEDHAHRLLRFPDPFGHDFGSLDGDEVRLGLRGDGFCEQRLPGSGWSVQEDAARRADAHPLERIRFLQRHLDRFTEFHLDFLEAADIGPVHAGHLDEDLAHGARLDLLQGLLEVVRKDAHLLERFRGNRLVEVDIRKVPPKRLHGGFAGERRKVRPDEPMADVREFREQTVPFLLDAFDRHAARVNLENLLADTPVRDANLDLAVEAPGPAQRGVDRLVPVRRADHDDLAATREAVHQGEKLRDDAPFDLAGHLFSLRSDRVEFIDEQDARSVLLGLLELLAEALLALSIVLRHDLRALDRIEIRARFVRHRLRDERLAGAGRSVQEDPFRRINPETLEQLRVFQRELDHLADLHQLLLESADVFVRDRWRQDLALADGLLFHLDDRVVLDLHDALRRGADHHERQRTAHERDSGDDDDVAFVERTLQQSPLDEILDPLAERDLVALADDRRDRDPLRGEDFGLADLDLVPEAHADVSADETVDADDAFAFVLLHDPEELRGGGLLAQNLDDLADVHSERDTGLRVDACPTQTDVRLGRFGHLEDNPLRHAYSNSPGLYQGSGTIIVVGQS